MSMWCLSLWLVAACATPSDVVHCGAGTVEMDGVCVPAERDGGRSGVDSGPEPEDAGGADVPARLDARVADSGTGCGNAPLSAGEPGGIALEGFGENATGGGIESGMPIVCVTTLADSGPGSLREALAGSDRRIHFAVGGTIMLETQLGMRSQANVTIDGSTAPPPGITLHGRELEIRSSSNIIVRHIRSRSTGDVAPNQPGITLFCPDAPCSDLWIDHVSVSRASDDSILVYEQVSDVTISYALIVDAYSTIDSSPEAMLISGSNPSYADRVTVHHSVLTGNFERNPSISGDPDAGDAATTVDFRNNIVHGWGNGGYGTRWRYNATGNAVGNLYLATGTAAAALTLESSLLPVFARGNLPMMLDTISTSATPIAAPPISEHMAADLRRGLGDNPVLDHVGARPLDAVDEAAIARVAAAL